MKLFNGVNTDTFLAILGEREKVDEVTGRQNELRMDL